MGDSAIARPRRDARRQHEALYRVPGQFLSASLAACGSGTEPLNDTDHSHRFAHSDTLRSLCERGGAGSAGAVGTLRAGVLVVCVRKHAPREPASK